MEEQAVDRMLRNVIIMGQPRYDYELSEKSIRVLERIAKKIMKELCIAESTSSPNEDIGQEKDARIQKNKLIDTILLNSSNRIKEKLHKIINLVLEARMNSRELSEYDMNEYIGNIQEVVKKEMEKKL